MRKRVYGKKLSRERDTRRALMRALMRGLVLHGKIKTTKAKAIAVQPAIEKLITLAKKETHFARKKVFARLGNDKNTAKIIFEKIVPLFKKREGGFTRIVNLPRRHGDNAEIVRLEFVKQIEEDRDRGRGKKVTKKREKKKGKEIEKKPKK